jgi:hypothetical protein
MDKWILIVHHKTDKDVTKMGAKFLVSNDQGLCHTLNSKPLNKDRLIVCIYSFKNRNIPHECHRLTSMMGANCNVRDWKCTPECLFYPVQCLLNTIGPEY